jgi:ABC-2 type transport system permease protein
LGEESTAVATTGKRRRRLRGRSRESNPLLIKELRGRMRGARAFVVLTVYLLLLSCFTSLIYYAYTVNARGPGGGPDMAYLGKVLFASVVMIEIFMVTFITPAFTAGAISGERERQTYELLRTTLLSARKLVFGKLSSALTYMLLLILAAVPMESLAFVLGGVVIEELAVALIVLLVTALAFAAIGLLFSAFLRTTLSSTALSYITALMLTIGLPVLMLISVALVESFLYDFDPTSSWIVEAALMYLVFFLVSLSPVSAAVATEIMLEQENAILYFWYDIDSTHRIPIPSSWTIYTVVYLALALFLVLITVLRVRRQEQR